MKILIVEPGLRPREADIEHTLEAMQGVVGGYIQAIYPWDDPVALVCDEEALLKESAFNRLISPNTSIFGTFFICGLSEDSFADLPQGMIEKYADLLGDPEMLIRTPSGPVVLHLMGFGLSEESEENTDSE